MNRRLALAVGTATFLGACAGRGGHRDIAQLTLALRDAETGFANTMAKRDLNAFANFLADDAVFINGGKPLRGKAAIVEHWKRFYSSAEAPFSWKPEIVEVVTSGDVGYSEGPVSLPNGTSPSRYFSTWRLNEVGIWKVVFDNGYDVCAKPKA